ncbi:MAG TPA: right-handed parallel beta-helix repeat-containing protein [bacterium]
MASVWFRPVLLAAAVSLLLAARPPWAGAAPLEIESDTVWQGTVDVGGEVRVKRGATLLVQPGSVVRFATERTAAGEPAARLVVNGVLVAQGTPSQPIVFTSAAGEPRPGDWGGIAIEHANERTSRISHARIEYAETGLSGNTSLLLVDNATVRASRLGVSAGVELNGSILDSTISGNDQGMKYFQASAFQVEHCEITGNGAGGIACLMGSSPALRRSTVAGNGGHGISCVQGSSPLIEGNAIRGHGQGIHVELQSRPLIRNNIITENDTGVWAEKYAFPTIAANDIRRNGVGIYCNFASYPVINGNNLDDNRRFAVVVGDNMSIKVEKLIPYRAGGSALAAAPAAPEALPPQTRKFTPFAVGEEGLVDARGNWWGAAALSEMERLGAEGNISVIEDFHDKPEVFYFDKPFPRDRVAFSSWEPRPLTDTGPPPSRVARIAGTVRSAGVPVPGVRVHAYKDVEGGFRGQGFAHSGPTAEDGSYTLYLPAGSYHLVAKGPRPAFPNAEAGPGDLYGLCAVNPVTVGAGETGTCAIDAAPLPAPGATERK